MVTLRWGRYTSRPMREPSFTLRFTVIRASLSQVLVACSEQGLCAVLLGTSRLTLERELGARFPSARLTEAAAALQPTLRLVLGAMREPGSAGPRHAILPLDLRGTPFQRAVWSALLGIASGETITYGELARRIGRPRAVRAVASACAANHVAVVVPCHRVLGAGGKLCGYRWGEGRKRALLEREARERPAA
jgi:AraC family transcriptional regulator of adaptative response/methylated-DNA-[protein]-cysteine methyltransferase